MANVDYTNYIEGITDEYKNRLYDIYAMGVDETCKMIYQIIDSWTEGESGEGNNPNKIDPKWLVEKIATYQNSLNLDIRFKNSLNNNSVSNEALENVAKVLAMTEEMKKMQLDESKGGGEDPED